MLKRVLTLMVLVLIFLKTFAIEVGGHLTEDTIWSPENNPYEITTVLYVDEEVTLTILPGTEIKIKSAPLASHQDANNYFWFSGGGEPDAKMIWVKGQIIAEGTENNVISFTRLYDETDHCWGVIYVDYMAEISLFDYCIFNFSGYTGIAVNNYNGATLSLCNRNSKITNCLFMGGQEAVRTKSDLESFLFYNNEVNYSNCIIAFLDCMGIIIRKPIDGFNPPLIAGNIFNNVSANEIGTAYIVNNYFYSCTELHQRKGYYSNNTSKHCDIDLGIDSNHGPMYIKNNQFIGGIEAVDVSNSYIEFSDNYLENTDFELYADNQSIIFNNRFNDTMFRVVGDCGGIYNNLYYNYDFLYPEQVFGSYKDLCRNNAFVNNRKLLSGNTDTTFVNCIILGHEALHTSPQPGRTDTFINCIIDFPLGDSLIDGGGNIIVDSTQVEQIFMDLLNEDFHLAPGSIAIDAGCDTLDYFYPFDMDYSHRIWDGDGDGNAVIDIGPYEYGSPSFGGISGNTYNPDTEEPVNYVLLKINNIAGEFTFSDSIGNFEYKLQEGVYDVYAERLYYDDVIMYEVEVIDGEFTDISIPMFLTTEAEENGILTPVNDIKLRNYPNPFNPETTISFSLTANDAKSVKLGIYNIKGQKIKELSPSLCHPELVEGRGDYSVLWDGRDEYNQPVGSGVYYCKLKSNNQESVRKMILIK